MKHFKKSSIYFTARKQQKTAYRKTFNRDFGWCWEPLSQWQWVELKLHPELLGEDEVLSASWDSVKGCLQGWRNAVSVKGRNGLKTIKGKWNRPTILQKKATIAEAFRPNVWFEDETETSSIEIIEEVVA